MNGINAYHRAKNPQARLEAITRSVMLSPVVATSRPGSYLWQRLLERHLGELSESPKAKTPAPPQPSARADEEQYRFKIFRFVSSLGRRFCY